ncbi:MAG: glutathione S-transferase N-terminal domain-containing protein [Rhodobacteraceae bacterium]|nr:glutathione S-transferase N-terminal domain-containing protein [Paracoccaceae bacterium]
MLTLRTSDSSPFVRKVKIAADILGVKDQLKIEDAVTSDPSDSLRAQNPLGKIPVLVLEDGTALYDSRVIVEYLDSIADGKTIFPSGNARFEALTLQATADGLMEAAVLQAYERRFRPKELRSADWIAYQNGKVERVLEVLETTPPAHLKSRTDATIGTIALACALAYLDLRYEGKWRSTCPKLATWLETFETAVPLFAATRQAPAPIPEDGPVIKLQ